MRRKTEENVDQLQPIALSKYPPMLLLEDNFLQHCRQAAENSLFNEQTWTHSTKMKMLIHSYQPSVQPKWTQTSLILSFFAYVSIFSLCTAFQVCWQFYMNLLGQCFLVLVLLLWGVHQLKGERSSTWIFLNRSDALTGRPGQRHAAFRFLKS